MKILYYTDQTYLHGGIERVLANKINYLVEQDDIGVYLLTTEQKNNKHCYQMNSKLTHIDLDINYHRDTSYFHPKNLTKIVNHFFKLRKEIKRINPDIIVVVNYDYAFYFMPFLHKKSKKIKEYHSSRYFESINRMNNKSFTKKILFKLNDYTEKKYNSIVVLTKDEQNHFKSKNTIVIPNGLSLTKDIAILREKIAISAGRIAPVKGFEKLIKAWKIVVNKHPDWKLKIYGEGNHTYLKELKELVNHENLNSNLCFCGQTKKLHKMMKNASMYIMTSHTECFPMVLLESKNIGLPIVSFDCPYGPRNIVNDNIDGILVENQNEIELAQSIVKLIDNRRLRVEMGKQAKQNIQNFAINNVMNKWLNLFKQ